MNTIEHNLIVESGKAVKFKTVKIAIIFPT